MATPVSDIAAMRNLNELREALADKLYTDLVKLGMLSSDARAIPPVMLLDVIMKEREPARSHLFNQLKNASFQVATSRTVVVRWDKANYVFGPVVEPCSLAVAIMILVTVEQMNRTYTIGAQSASMSGVDYTGAAPVMISWDTFKVEGEETTMRTAEIKIQETDHYQMLLKYFIKQFEPVQAPDSHQADQLFAPSAKVIGRIQGLEKQIETDYKRESGSTYIQTKVNAPPQRIAQEAFKVNKSPEQVLPHPVGPSTQVLPPVDSQPMAREVREEEVNHPVEGLPLQPQHAQVAAVSVPSVPVLKPDGM